MHTVLLGTLHAPSKYREYIQYIKRMQMEGTVYKKEIVDGLITRFIEVVDDNYHMKEVHIQRKERRIISIVDGSKDGREDATPEENSEVSNSGIDKISRIITDMQMEGYANYTHSIIDEKDILYGADSRDMVDANNRVPRSAATTRKPDSHQLAVPHDINELKHHSPAEKRLESAEAEYEMEVEGAAEIERSSEAMPETCSAVVTEGLSHRMTSSVELSPSDMPCSQSVSLDCKVLRIREEISGVSAYAISLLLICAQMEDVLAGK
ncbi:uncharacterized protein NESG_02058 [Nematocida ausubeli]|uniref:Uncharacterized protein n=1 Tax=Nematocida ausubeli (strain ATCC PRA-371 / ERTm2) TaxID=1913371 RepID=A0A086IZG9_NEMA1|nr:uncharacterized protein NESG_02058 [Nematocida ausubeli]KFG25287.1 hypothetical protein NESG_02058 [Nematocida ausubeli]